MKLLGLACACGADELLAIAPGQSRVAQGNLYFLVREREDEGWCEACWHQRYGLESRPPLRGGLVKT